MSKYLVKATCIFTLFFSTKVFSQQFLTQVDGWNAYVHLPWDYAQNPGKSYPTIIFLPGIGEVGSNAAEVISNGPGAYIQSGWKGNVKVGADSVKFIIISLQPSSAYPAEALLNTRIQTLKSMYRIDNARLHLTGLSMGGWCSTTFVTGDPAAGPYTYASQVATVVEVEGMRPDDNIPYPNLFDNFAKTGGRLLGFEQINDSRDIQTRVNRMNSVKPNSGIFVSTNFGSGGHCCWEQFYGGKGVQPGNFMLDGISQNLYQWMARNPSPDFNVPPDTGGGGMDTTGAISIDPSKLNGNVTGINKVIHRVIIPLNPLINPVTPITLANALRPMATNDGSLDKDNGAVTITNNNRPVPFSIIDFFAGNNMEKTQLQWKTFSEVNTAYFQIERSSDGMRFESMGRVNAKGSYSAANDYSYSDGFPFSGKNYYRLMIVDKSGEINYSKVISVFINSNKSIVIGRATMQSGGLHISLSSSREQNINVIIADVNGRIFLDTKVFVQKGINIINKNISIPSAGIYFIKLSIKDEQVVKPIINF